MGWLVTAAGVPPIVGRFANFCQFPVDAISLDIGLQSGFVYLAIGRNERGCFLILAQVFAFADDEHAQGILFRNIKWRCRSPAIH